MELGIYTFGDIVPDPQTGRMISQGERMAEMLELAKLADELGLDIIGVGEHHGPQFVGSSTATVMAAMAAATTNIRLTSASTLIATADPVRTFQEFAIVDLVSKGRAEVIFGRGAFTENFPLFGYDLKDYDALFVEKVQLFLDLNARERVTWSGRFRTPLSDMPVNPRPYQAKLPVWIGALSPQSVARSAAWGLPLALPMIGSSFSAYAKVAKAYREAWVEHGHDPNDIRIAAFSHLNVAETSRAAREDFYPYYTGFFSYLSGRGGIAPEAFQQMSAPDGVLLLGSPQEIVDRLMLMRREVGITRYLGQVDIGARPFSEICKGLERFATKVAPVIRKETNK